MSYNAYIVCEAQNTLNGKPTTVGDPSRWTWASFQDWGWFIVVRKVHKKLSGFPWLWCSSRLSSRELNLALDAALVQIWATCGSPQCLEKYQRGDLAVQEQHRNSKMGPVHKLLNKTIQGLRQPRDFFPKLTQPTIWSGCLLPVSCTSCPLPPEAAAQNHIQHSRLSSWGWGAAGCRGCVDCKCVI